MWCTASFLFYPSKTTRWMRTIDNICVRWIHVTQLYPTWQNLATPFKNTIQFLQLPCSMLQNVAQNYIRGWPPSPKYSCLCLCNHSLPFAGDQCHKQCHAIIPPCYHLGADFLDVPSTMSKNVIYIYIYIIIYIYKLKTWNPLLCTTPPRRAWPGEGLVIWAQPANIRMGRSCCS